MALTSCSFPPPSKTCLMLSHRHYKPLMIQTCPKPPKTSHNTINIYAHTHNKTHVINKLILQHFSKSYNLYLLCWCKWFKLTRLNIHLDTSYLTYLMLKHLNMSHCSLVTEWLLLIYPLRMEYSFEFSSRVGSQLPWQPWLMTEMDVSIWLGQITVKNFQLIV